MRAPLLALLLLAGCAAPAPPAPAPITIPGEALSAVAQRELARQRLVGLGAGVVIQGRVAWLGGFGFADREAGELLDPTVHQLRWASLAKSVNGALAARQAVSGALTVDDDVNTLIPGAPAGVTVRQLLTHTGGVQSYDDGSVDPTPPLTSQLDPTVNTGFVWALDAWMGAPLLAEPGREFRYSTLSHNLAGAAVGASAARSGEAADTAWFRLLDAMLAGTGADVGPDREWAPRPQRAKGYRLADDGRVYPSADVDVSWKAPGGGLISTVQGLATWCALLAGDAVLDAAAKKLMWAPQPLAEGGTSYYGFGVGLGERDGRRTIEHDGGQEKTRTRMVLYPDDGLCFVAMTNTESSGRYPVEMRRVTDGLEDVVRAALK